MEPCRLNRQGRLQRTLTVRDLLASDDQEGAEFVVRLALDAHPTSFAIQRLLDEVRSHPVSELSDRQLYVERMSQLLDR